MDRYETIKASTSRLMHLHNCENDVEGIVATFDPQISWIGPAEREYCVGEQAVSAAFRACLGKIPRCILEEEHYDVLELGPELYLCTGRFWVRTAPETELYLRSIQRISAVWRWTPAGPRCVHLHLSLSNGEMTEQDEVFPLQVGRRSYEYIQENLRRMALDLQEKNRLLTSVYDTVSCAILRFSRREGIYALLSMNPAAERLLNLGREQILARDWSRGVNPLMVEEDMPAAAAALAALRKTGDTSHADYRVRLPDGSLRYLSTDNMLLTKTGDGEIIQRIIYDVTRRVELEQQMAREREVYRLALESSYDLMYQYSVQEDRLEAYYLDRPERAEEDIQVLKAANFNREMERTGMICPEDVPLVRRNICQGRCETFDARVSFAVPPDGDFLWARITGKGIFQGDTLVRVVGTVRNINSEKIENQILAEEAARDALTGLYGRRYALRSIQETLSAGGRFCFLLMDLDNFKTINDTYGHMLGDQVLTGLAGILAATFRSGDICARMGGDEFMVFLPGAPPLEVIRSRTDRLRLQYQEMMERLGIRLAGGVSIGGVLGEGNYSFQEIYGQADRLLYQVKYERKGFVKFFTLGAGDED